MKDFNELVLKHKGKRICIMGGAASLEDDLKQIEADIYISTNAHGIEFKTPDYIFAMDETNTRLNVPMGGFLRDKTDVQIISPRAYADYQLITWPQAPRDVLSGMVATWAAFMMGAKVVILAGMDAYDGKSGFVHEATKMARDVNCPVRVMSESLAKVWPKYDAKEKFVRYVPHSSINSWLDVDEKITIEVVKATTIRNLLRQKGEQLKVMRHEVITLLKHKMIKEV
jgi:hypothetical protein